MGLVFNRLKQNQQKEQSAVGLWKKLYRFLIQEFRHLSPFSREAIPVRAISSMPKGETSSTSSSIFSGVPEALNVMEFSPILTTEA